MGKDRRVTLRLSGDIISTLTSAAQANGCSAADIVRSTLDSVLTAGKSLPDAAVFGDTVLQAADWIDLQSRLRRAGFVLRMDRAGRLNLHNWPLDQLLAPGESVGLVLAPLVLRFRAPFPGTGPLPVTADTRPLPDAQDIGQGMWRSADRPQPSIAATPLEFRRRSA